jgi:uncharacterized SAM-binding protein YcdF (DUF218 family)
LALIGVVVVIFLAVTARLFIWPPIDHPTKVDAIVALGGDPGERRMAAALKLAKEGYAPTLVISLGGDPPIACPRAPARVRVVCFRPNPLNTRGEAEYVATLASHRHWHRIIVVPNRSQTTRARLLFKRCTGIDLEMVPVSDKPSELFVSVFYEWGALMKALVVKRSC